MKKLILLLFIPFFCFSQSGTDIDQDGNNFEYFTIGNQTWTLGHPKMTNYRDGTPIPNFSTDLGGTYNGTQPRQDAYDLIDPNDPSKGNIYNYKAVHGEYELYAWGENRKKLAPIGWRLPTIDDYAELLCFLMQNNFAINISGNNENCDAFNNLDFSDSANWDDSFFSEDYSEWEINNHLAPSIMSENDWTDMLTGDSYYSNENMLNDDEEDTYHPPNNSSGFGVGQSRIIHLTNLNEVTPIEGFAFWSLSPCIGENNVIPYCSWNTDPDAEWPPNLYESPISYYGFSFGQLDLYNFRYNSLTETQIPYTTNLSLHPYIGYSLLNVRFIRDEAPVFTDTNSVVFYLPENVCSVTDFNPEVPSYFNDDIYPVSIEYTSNIPENLTAGEYQINWTAIDESENLTEFVQILTVYDSNPVAICNDISLTLENGNISISAAEINNGSYDSCSEIVTEIYQMGTNFGSEISFNSENLGENTVQLVVTDSSGNTSSCNATVTIQAGMGLNENSFNLKVFPNPAQEFLYIDTDYELEAYVFDLLGKQVMREYITDKLDISCLEKGTYILNLSDGINTSTHKIIKE